jgi:hypothetical protein
MIFCGFKLSQRCLIQHKSRKIDGFFKVNCGTMDGDLRRLKKILEAP